VTSTLTTNRDLYLAINTLSKEHEDSDRTLETYLLAILSRSAGFAECESLSLDELHELITSGFTHEPLPFNNAWRTQYDVLPYEDNCYKGWQATVIRQIVDLREMDENGTLNSEQRHFGLSSPRKAYWYNFEPFGYLECAAAGAFGGWEPSDSSRQYLPGLVAVLAEDGSIQFANPEDLPNVQFEIPAVSWEQFKNFIFCGQTYE
jgi:hypothetical protein